MQAQASAQTRLQFDFSPETLAESEIISAVSNPDLGLRLRAIHAISLLTSSISLPTLFIICQPNNPCQTTAWLACAELCNIASKNCLLLPQILPSILDMGSITNQRCSRTIRIPLYKLISNPDLDSASKKALSSLASSLNIEFTSTRKRAGSSLDRTRVAARNPAEDRLIHERLDNFPLQTQIELIVRCIRLNLPNIDSTNFKMDDSSFKKLLQLLLEQDILIRDPRLRDPRLRGSIVIPEAQLASDLQLISSTIQKMGEQLQKSGQTAALLVKKTVPDIPILELEHNSRQDLRNLAFQRMMSNCSKSRITEAVITQMLVKYDSSRISQLLELFRSDPMTWLEVMLQLGYVLVASDLKDVYIDSMTTVIESLWSAPAGVLSRFLCICALLPDEAVMLIDQACQSDSDLKRTMALFALRDIVMKRPADKLKILQLLLTYGASSNAALRNPAVSLITCQLLSLGNSIEEQIVQYATQLFRTIAEPFEVEIQGRVNAEQQDVQHDLVSKADLVSEAECSDVRTQVEPVQAEMLVDTDAAEHNRDPLLSDTKQVDEDATGEHTDQFDDGDGVITNMIESAGTENMASDADKSNEGCSVPSSADALIEAETNRRLELYFSLCSKKHELFPYILEVFSSVTSRGTCVRACFHMNIPKLVRSIGSSSPFLIEAFKQSPSGSEPLVLHALHILTGGAEDLFSPSLIEAAQICYSRCRDARFLIPVLSGMKRAQVLEALPHIVALPKVHVEQAFKLLLNPGAPVSPSEVLVRLHIIAPTPEHPLLRKVMDAIQICIFNKEAYNEKVLAVVLQQVVERNPIPVLFMRTLIQVLAVYPLLTEFAITILARLVNKRIWDLANLELWQGFIVCCMRTVPHSYPIMLQLPSSKLAQLIDRSKEPAKLRLELARFVQNSRVEVRRSIQSLLGLARRFR